VKLFKRGSAEGYLLREDEVLIEFDNSDHLLPLNFIELEVGRRIFRSRASKYYVNNDLRRPPDIQKLSIKYKGDRISRNG